MPDMKYEWDHVKDNRVGPLIRMIWVENQGTLIFRLSTKRLNFELPIIPLGSGLSLTIIWGERWPPPLLARIIYIYLSMKSIQFIFFIIFLRGGFGEDGDDDDGAMEESIIHGLMQRRRGSFLRVLQKLQRSVRPLIAHYNLHWQWYPPSGCLLCTY